MIARLCILLAVCGLAGVSFAQSTRASPDRPTLTDARNGFSTKHRPSRYRPDAPIPAPPKGIYELIKYRSPAGELAAILTPNPNDGKRRPAIVWCHGGFGGLDESYWAPQKSSNDQTPKAFLDAGFVVMIPSWRGENDNPGRFELYLGEVDDALAAVDHVRALPYVDPSHVYLVGHSSGGAVAVLAGMSNDADRKVRAVFSFGGTLDCRRLRIGWEPIIPFDPADEREMKVRSPIDFVGSVRVPTWYIEGGSAVRPAEINRLVEDAARYGVPVTTCVIKGGDHFDILRPLTRLLAERIANDSGEKRNLDFDVKAAQAAFDAEFAERLKKRKGLPLVTLTPAAAKTVKAYIDAEGMKIDQTWLKVDKGLLDLTDVFDPATQIETTQQGIRIAVLKTSAERLRGLLIDYKSDEEGKGFLFSTVADD